MESSEYLRAIQQVPGKTPGEKYKTLNQIARSSIRSEPATKRPRISHEEKSFYFDATAKVPAILTPLLELEVAKILREPDVIVEALKSTNVVLFNRALKIKWFFDASYENITNVEYFKTRIFPYISVIRRYYVLKTLAAKLAFRKPGLAEEFYNAITDSYGEKQARPLLIACGLSLILNKVNAAEIKLTSKEIKQFFNNNGEFFEKYCQPIMAWHCEEAHLLIKRHSDHYVALIPTLTRCIWQLPSMSSKRTKSLIRNGVELKNYPALIPKLSLKMLNKRMRKDQFEELIQPQFPAPEKIESDFNFNYFHNFLTYYCPKEERTGHILRWFEKSYNKSLFEYEKFITPQILRDAPWELRVKYARKQIESDENWNANNYTLETLWKCYLPTAESIPELKSRIAITSNATQRCNLLEALIYTCHVNSDKDALLKVLKYLVKHHKNERNNVITHVLTKLRYLFDLNTLSLDYWELIDQFETMHNNKIIIAAIQYKLIHNISIEEKIDLYLKKTAYSGPFDALLPKTHYKRQFMNLIVEKILSVGKKDTETWKSIEHGIHCELASAIWTFNHAKKEDTTEMISLKNYPEIETTVKKLFIESANSKHHNWQASDLQNKLKLGDPDLYHEYFPNDTKDSSEKSMIQGLKLLKTNPDEVLENWKIYLEMANIYHSSFRACKLFFHRSLWHQELPIKFITECRRKVENKESYTQLYIKLALISLVESQVIEKAALSTSEEIKDCSYWEIIRNYKLFRVLNPTPSVNIFLKYYEYDQREAAVFLRTTATCISSNTVIFCASKMLENRKISIQRQGIMLMKLCATTEEFHRVLKEVLATQKHLSIRKLIYEEICCGLCITGNSNLWLLWNECIDSITPRDRGIIEQLKYSEKFPKKYIVECVNKLFKIYKYLNNIKKPDEEILDNKNFLEEYTIDLLQSIYSYLIDDFSEGFHKEIFRTYLDVSLSHNILETMIYCAKNYIVKEKINQSRLEYITNMLIPILKNNWDIPDPNNPSIYPAQLMLRIFDRVFWDYTLNDSNTPQLIQKTLTALSSALSPFQMPYLYLRLMFKSTVYHLHSAAEIARAICKILPTFIQTFSIQFFDTITKSLQLVLKKKLNYYKHSKIQIFSLEDLLEAVLKVDDDLGVLFVSTYICNHYKIRGTKPKKLKQYSNIVKILLKSDNSHVQANINWHLQNKTF